MLLTAFSLQLENITLWRPKTNVWTGRRIAGLVLILTISPANMIYKPMAMTAGPNVE